MTNPTDEKQYQDLRFMFDVESVGLHGNGFAYGYVVTAVDQETGQLIVLDKGEKYSIEGGKEALGNEWVRENVLPTLPLLPYISDTPPAGELPEIIVETNRQLRDAFFEKYSEWKVKGAEIYSDVNWPVETGFLSAVIKDDLPAREFAGPYPLMDASNTLCKIERDMKVMDREEYSQLPEGGRRKHNPLDDAIASAFALHRAEIELQNPQVTSEIASGDAKIKTSSNQAKEAGII